MNFEAVGGESVGRKPWVVSPVCGLGGEAVDGDVGGEAVDGDPCV